jgi:hypothetical protein
MIGQELKSLSYAQNLFTRLLGMLGGDAVKERFEVGKRSFGYFDRRHARALGRCALAPAQAVRMQPSVMGTQRLVMRPSFVGIEIIEPSLEGCSSSSIQIKSWPEKPV